VVVTFSVVGIADFQHKRLHTGQANFTLDRRVAGVHHAALPKHLAVGMHDEFHAGRGVAVNFVNRRRRCKQNSARRRRG